MHVVANYVVPPDQVERFRLHQLLDRQEKHKMQISRIVNKEINESGASRGEDETDLEEDDDEVEEEEEVQEVEEGDDSDDEDDNTLKVVLKTDTGLASVWFPVSNHLVNAHTL
jgi:hypothetical protein